MSNQTVYLVGPAFSDLQFVAGMNGLTSPLPGLAKQELWLQVTDDIASKEKMKSFVWKSRDISCVGTGLASDPVGAEKKLQSLLQNRAGRWFQSNDQVKTLLQVLPLLLYN